ncbi:MAG TPA: DUF3089 domain-containing protein [Thermoanaerobaculia bacterium]|nr:DUF3089 domain-containing protein [Thermoanaerobaculia bacterium]
MRKVLLVAAIAALALPASAGAKTTWLCKPGAKPDPCVGSLTASVVDANNHVLGTRTAKNAKNPPIDCFYVYPTISDQQRTVATLSRDPEEVSIAEFQGQRFSQVCRVFAPLYQQITIKGLGSAPTPAQFAVGQRELVAAWHEYLKKYNHGRGVVFIGHSQGSLRLRSLLASEVDKKPAIRKLLVSAIIPGGNVIVKKGSDTGGDFQHIAACRRSSQTGCVIAYSMFGSPPPANSIFGRANVGYGSTTRNDVEVLCTNPAALGGGSGTLAGATRSKYPPGTIGLGVRIFEGALPAVSTPWLVPAGTYTASCASSGGANWLQVTAGSGARVFTASPDATWGFHLGDINLAVDSLVGDIRSEAKAYLKHR